MRCVLVIVPILELIMDRIHPNHLDLIKILNKFTDYQKKINNSNYQDMMLVALDDFVVAVVVVVRDLRSLSRNHSIYDSRAICSSIASFVASQSVARILSSNIACSNSCCSDINNAFSTNDFSAIPGLNAGSPKPTPMVALYGFTIEL
ncbi:hypothetical protein DERF_006447 [Dermatophagoides farinae]|uniref:Uncharacterized protein n=1 Tax=Dermatophagoides farinae TaxID=6954 RepID=A0A922LC53_DERFA|nr:hypothetical protein DERF_006447 [Dermatophagoides farinae]